MKAIIQWLFGPKTAGQIMYDLEAKGELLRSSESQFKELSKDRINEANELKKRAAEYSSEAEKCSKVAAKIQKLFDV